MLAQHHHQFEIHGSAATIYVAGSLTVRQARRLRADCLALPANVRTLRIDLHAVTTHAPEAIDAVTRMVRDWRTQRRGRCCLSLAAAQLASSSRQSSSVSAAEAGVRGPEHSSCDALMGTYL